ncbi:unnamed protein product [Effrenium voratum]|nr:unnamed protein product [Effrenium voratum]
MWRRCLPPLRLAPRFRGGFRNVRGVSGAERCGVVLDIDGVVRRGGEPIQGAKEALWHLEKASVPYIFMTNGGGVTEAKKAQELSELLEVELDESRVILSHTPFRLQAERLRSRRVVLVGGCETEEVARSYGFDVGGRAITSSQIVLGSPDIYPWPVQHGELPPVDVHAAGPPIEAVLIFYEPENWGMELQVLSDVLAGGLPLGSGASQAAELWVSNPDFLWQAGYPVPRFGMGAFVESLQALWRRRTGGELRVEECGKPFRVQFEAARELLSQVSGDTLDRIYMIGDNPAADIRGANQAGDPWRSILDPAWRVEPDLLSAVRRLL